jgi:hypothetical protein
LFYADDAEALLQSFSLMDEEEQKDLEEHYSNLNYWTIYIR